jgi:hypothetical protein
MNSLRQATSTEEKLRESSWVRRGHPVESSTRRPRRVDTFLATSLRCIQAMTFRTFNYLTFLIWAISNPGVPGPPNRSGPL